MKKVFIVFLTFVLLVSTVFNVAAAETQTEEAAIYDITRPEEEIKILGAIGFIDADSYEESSELTRGEAAQAFTKAANLETDMFTEALSFYDVGSDSSYYTAIGNCKALGIMSGYSEWEFKPNANITVQETVTSLIRLLGQSIMADKKGGYPSGYIYQATSIGLLDKIPYEAMQKPCTKYILAQLFYNMLDIHVYDIEAYSKKNELALTKSGKYLEAVFDIVKSSGVLEGTKIAALYNDADVSEEGYVRIDGKLYKTEDTTLNRYLGYNMEFYYKRNDDSIADSLLYAAPKYDDSVVEIDKTEIISVTEDNIKYQKDEKVYNRNINNQVIFIYNNMPAQSFDLSKLNAELSGKITLIDNGGNSGFDVVRVEEYSNIFINGIDLNQGIIYDKYSPLRKISFNPDDVDDTVLFFDEDGEADKVTSLTTDMLVSCLESQDGKVIMVYTGKRIMGNITHIAYEEEKISEIGVGGEPFNVAPSIKDYLTDLSAGDEDIVFYLDKTGCIAGYIKETESEYEFAYIKKVGQTKGLKPQLEIYCYVYGSEKGKFSTIACDKKIYVDGTKYTNSKTDLDTMELYLSQALNQPILIKQNQEGKLTEIKTIDGGGLIDLGTTKNYWYTHISQNIGVSEITKVLFVSSEDGKEKVFDSAKMTDLQTGNDVSYPGRAYKTDADQIGARLIVLDSASNGLTSNAKCIVISNLKRGINENGEDIELVTGYVGGALETYINGNETVLDMSGNETTLKVGDMVRFDAEEQEFTNLQIVVRASENRVCASSPSDPDRWASSRVFEGYGYQREGNMFLFSYADPKENVIVENDDNLEYRSVSTSGVYIYDASQSINNRVTKGTANDILTYKQVGNGASRVLAWTRGHLVTIMIIK